MTAPDLKVNLGRGLTLANPVIAASGTYGYGTEYAGICPPQDWGAVVLKSVSLHPRIGNLPQRITETPCGMLNSIGLANVGVATFLGTKLGELADYINMGAVVVANLAAESVDEFAELTRRISDDGRVRAAGREEGEVLPGQQAGEYRGGEDGQGRDDTGRLLRQRPDHEADHDEREERQRRYQPTVTQCEARVHTSIRLAASRATRFGAARGTAKRGVPWIAPVAASCAGAAHPAVRRRWSDSSSSTRACGRCSSN